MELTILMPCLNEAASVAACVQEAAAYLQSRKILGEVLVGITAVPTDPRNWQLPPVHG